MDDEGVRQTIGSGDVNDYIKEISGEEFTDVFETYLAGTLPKILQNGTKAVAKVELNPEESAVVRLLRHQLATGVSS